MDNDKPSEGETIEDIEVQTVSEPSAFGNIAQSIGSRNLMIAIVTMPVVFLAVVLGILAVTGPARERDNAGEVRQRVTAGAVRSTPIDATHTDAPGRLIEPSLAAVPAQAPSLSPNAIAAEPSAPYSRNSSPVLVAPVGGEAKSMALDGDRLAVWFENEDGRAVIVYDLATGAIVRSTPIVTEVGPPAE